MERQTELDWLRGLMLVLMVGSVAFTPVVLPLLIPGLEADTWPLLRPLLFSMLLPLAAGMGLRPAFYPPAPPAASAEIVPASLEVRASASARCDAEVSGFRPPTSGLYLIVCALRI